jgi:hypothetical protein
VDLNIARVAPNSSVRRSFPLGFGSREKERKRKGGRAIIKPIKRMKSSYGLRDSQHH